MDKTGLFIVAVLILGILWNVIDTSLKVWKYNVEHRKTREDRYNWEDRI